MNDSISRQAAIDVLIAEIKEKAETYWDNGLNIYDVESVLKGLPSVQTEQRLTCKNCIHLGHGYMMPCKNCKRNQMLPDWYEVETERQEE